VEAGGRRTLGFEFDTGVTVANGGLNAPIADMARYLDFMIGAAPPDLSEQILPRPKLERLWRPRFRADYDASVDERMASHFFTIDCRGGDGRNRRFVGHTGSQHGYRAFVYWHLPSRAWTIMAVNSTASPPRPFVFNSRRRLFADVFPAVEA
jgi:CubicO group peptidase (beta-lactamase class C family)